MGLNEQGFEIVRGVFSPGEVGALIANLPPLDGVAGTRTLLAHPIGQELIRDPRVLELARSCVGAHALAVRGILFDKQPGTNWVLGWHQDTKIAMRERREVPGYTAWSVKEGVPHCQPPVEVLEQCVAVRIHLDDCAADNGALRVIPGSHLRGYHDDVDEQQSLTLECRAGDVILMKPLTQHASSKAVSPSHRRVIHIEWCGVPLADGLEWHFA